jgi:hypothetical protein
LEGAGIEATLADEHLVSMNWAYSNAVGGVKVLVPDDQLEEAKALLASGAVVLDAPSAENKATGTGPDTCRRCGGREFESRLSGRRFAIWSWLAFGAPLGSPHRQRFCRHCGAPAPDHGTSV